jgi:hypothetical protein
MLADMCVEPFAQRSYNNVPCKLCPPDYVDIGRADTCVAHLHNSAAITFLANNAQLIM